VQIYAKVEGANPSGSIKDRAALALLEAAEKNGDLFPDARIIEASSGNTGIALATLCRARGYTLTLAISERASRERLTLLRSLGVELVLTSRRGGTDEARRVADELAKRHPDRFLRLSQHRSWSIIEMHERVTSREIIAQVPEAIDYLVAGIGTGATLMGTSIGLKRIWPELQVVGVQPTSSVTSQEGLRNIHLTTAAEIFDSSLLDRIVDIEDDVAKSLCRAAIEHCGIFCGVSSGSALAGALRLIDEGVTGTIVTIFPDRSDRYFSTSLFAND